MRMCVGCREMKPKKELIRVVKRPTGEIVMDPTGKLSGRGAYVCRNEACLTRAIKQKQLDRALEQKLDDQVMDQLRAMLKALPPPSEELEEQDGNAEGAT
jgi:predicted RNA-binding protein YlxR (DUF448 family)